MLCCMWVCMGGLMVFRVMEFVCLVDFVVFNGKIVI